MKWGLCDYEEEDKDIDRDMEKKECDGERGVNHEKRRDDMVL